jgi:hypothetical protein
MKVYWGSVGIGPCILGPRYWMEMNGQIHDPAALPPQNGPPLPIDSEARWAPEPAWTRWWEEEFTATAGTRNPDHQARSLALCRTKEAIRHLEQLLNCRHLTRSQSLHDGRLQSSWTHLITPNRNFVEVRWRSLFRSTSLSKRCTYYNAPLTSRKRDGLQTVDHFEISCPGAPFPWLEKPRNRMGWDLNLILC